MKRTPLKRKTPLKAKSPMKRKPSSTGSGRVKKSAPKSQSGFRSRRYLDWVKQQPCVMCGCPADDPHHLIGIGHMSGMGRTAPDSMAMPVCRQHHNEIHQTPELWPQQFEWIARTLNKALAEGVLEAAK